jgi:hypothetical protein
MFHPFPALAIFDQLLAELWGVPSDTLVWCVWDRNLKLWRHHPDHHTISSTPQSDLHKRLLIPCLPSAISGLRADRQISPAVALLILGVLSCGALLAVAVPLRAFGPLGRDIR